MKAWLKENWIYVALVLCPIIAFSLQIYERHYNRLVPRTYIYEPKIVGYVIRDSVPILEYQEWITYTLDTSHISKDSAWCRHGDNESSISVGSETTLDTVGWTYDTTYVYAYPPDSVRVEVKEK